MKENKIDDLQKKVDELKEMMEDWKKSYPQQVTYVPIFIEKDTYDPYYQDPCRYCNNNPRNNPFASGVCHCVLPYTHGREVIY